MLLAMPWRIWLSWSAVQRRMEWVYAPHRAELAEEIEEILWGHVEAQILDEQSTAQGSVSRGRVRRAAPTGGRQRLRHVPVDFRGELSAATHSLATGEMLGKTGCVVQRGVRWGGGGGGLVRVDVAAAAAA